MSPASTYVIGHKNPDTDAICAALGYAEYLQRTGDPSAEAACCGGINPRTQWVLEKAGAEPPKLLMDVRPTAGTICRKDPVVAHSNETFLEVYSRMERAQVRAVPVVDEDGQVMGLLTAQDMLELLMHSTLGDGSHESARLVETSIDNVCSTLNAELLCGDYTDVLQTFVLTVSASSDDTVEERLNRFPDGQLLVLIGDRPGVQRLVIEHGVRAIVLTSAAELGDGLLELAKERGVALLRSPVDTATTAQLIRCSRPIASAVQSGVTTYSEKAPLGSFIKEVQASRQVLFPVVREVGGKLVGVFSKSELLNPPRQKLVLVDHNEFSQAVNGASEADIVQVLDHHRLGGNLISREPIRFINEPVGSTSTIIGRMFQQQGLTPTSATALCLVAGLISDTLNLTSPTTTDVDRELLPWLAAAAGVEVNQFTRDFFAAGSMLKSWPAGDMVGLDRKEFNERGWKISISQIEEVEISAFDSRREELVSALQKLITNRGLDLATLLVTDISRHVSILLVVGSDAVSAEIDYPAIGPDCFRLDGVVSRKKQFFPYISRVLGRVAR